MVHIFTSKTYDALASEFQSALAWLSGVGVSYERTRIGEYERAIDALVASFKASDFDTIRADLLRILTALFEIHDLIDVHKILAGRFDSEIHQHINTFATGPIHLMDENPATSSNKARNIAFELVLMAKLANAGIPLDFSIKTDVAAIFDKHSLLFECKRPQSISSLEKRIKDAFQQLENKYRSPQRLRHRGIVALDISKLINPDFLLYIQDDANALNAGLSQIIDDFIVKHEHLWQKQRNKKTIGVLIRLSVMGVNKSKNIFTHCQQYGISPMNHTGERNKEIVKKLVEVLHDALVKSSNTVLQGMPASGRP